MPINPAATLAQAIAYVLSHRTEGVRCPCCGQMAKVYRRSINSGMARSLIAMYRAGGKEFIHVPTVLDARSREEGKLRYWNLVEEQLAARPDGGRAGYWRVTDLGERFVLNRTYVQKYALVYDGTCFGVTGSPVNIREALGNKFNYRELMDA